MAGSRGNITGEKEKEEGRRHDRCNRQKTKTGKLKKMFLLYFSASGRRIYPGAVFNKTIPPRHMGARYG
jgi:hypothetical protein